MGEKKTTIVFFLLPVHRQNNKTSKQWFAFLVVRHTKLKGLTWVSNVKQFKIIKKKYLPEDRTEWWRRMGGRWWGTACSCTRLARAPAWCPSASWWSSCFALVTQYTTPGWVLCTRVRERCHGPSQSNRQTVTLFPHNTRQFRYFCLERVQLYNENHPHGCRFQPLDRIRRRTNKSSECGMELKEIMRKT